MGTRSSRLQEDGVPPAFGKGDLGGGPCRRHGSKRPSSLLVAFSGTFEQDSEASRSRPEDPDRGQQASASGGSANRSPGRPGQAESANNNKQPGDGSPAGDLHRGLLSAEMGRLSHRTFSERLVVSRQVAGRNGSVRTGRPRAAHPRPVSEAWIGRVSNRHGTIRCPSCSKPFPGSRIDDHLLSCLTSPPLPYNTDTLTKDSGECSVCLEDLLQGDTIARLACLCVYHKSCIDSWSKVKACCPEHPFN